MHRLPQLILIALCFLSWPAKAQENPHGADFKVDCKQCHNTGSWAIARDQLSYDHSKTGFPLEGQHAKISCSDCHQSLDFKSVSSECLDCHLDVHEMSVGNDCARCHNNTNWLVQDIGEVHEQNAFPLEGAHTTASCIDCHRNGNSLVWERQSGECVDCHQNDVPIGAPFGEVHQTFGTSCADCHSPFSPRWTANFFHEFFPLTKGHSSIACADCHTSQTYPYTAVDPDCYACHFDDFDNTSDPNHFNNGIPSDCIQCHTTDYGWRTKDHDSEWFPIYSGKHRGEWNDCTTCHNNPGNFMDYSCIDCHKHRQSQSDDDHKAGEKDEVKGYLFESTACFQCHPRGTH